MSELETAYNKASSTLKPQKQGTCGLYSFWYASLLLSCISGGRRPIVYPRGGEGGTGESMRHFAKQGVGSGQGEVLSCAEMESIIRRFGYDCESHVQKEGRRVFVTSALLRNRPVLFPYMFGNTGPISAFPVHETPGVDYGPHWSLIYAQDGGNYLYIEPNNPITPVRQPIDTVLNSNSFADNYKYDRYWSKGGKFDTQTGTPLPYQYTSGIAPVGNVKGSAVKYDIGDKSRQTLANVLIAVF